MPETPSAPPLQPTLAFTVDGRSVEVADDGRSLLDVLREDLGVRGPKDGCSPQGQCGCCTVLVDGAARVACVTPARRVAGRVVETIDGLAPEVLDTWTAAFLDAGASQCGFCTPGIVVRLEGLRRRTEGAATGAGRAEIDRALAAHLCRCTGWQPIRDAAAVVLDPADPPVDAAPADAGSVTPVGVRGVRHRDPGRAADRATLEGGSPQRVDADVVRGAGGFADDTAPAGALVAVPDGAGGWAVGETLAEARAVAGKVQGRRTTVEPAHPLEVPRGDWAATLRTTWVEPAYLETDASWCEPGGEPASPLGNGGAFGGKLASPLPEVARRLADRHGRAVRVLWSREDVVRHGPKRPPVAGGARADGTGVLRVVATPGVEVAVAEVAPGLVVEPVAVAGPPTSVALRAAGWAEAVVLLAGARGRLEPVRAPGGGEAEAEVRADGSVRVRVRGGDPLDEVVLRSYCVGAAHMALGWVQTEGLATDADGAPLDLTVRSFGVLRAADTPRIDVEVDVEADPGPPRRVADAVFAAVAAAVWLHRGCPQDWPCGAA